MDQTAAASAGHASHRLQAAWRLRYQVWEIDAIRQRGDHAPRRQLLSALAAAMQDLSATSTSVLDQRKVDGSYFFNFGGGSHELKFGSDFRELETMSGFTW
jgi:hypothetical protein